MIDPDDYSISDPYEISEFGFVERMRSEGATNEGTVKIGDYSIIRYWINDGVFASYVLEIIDGDDNVTELDLREEFPTYMTSPLWWIWVTAIYLYAQGSSTEGFSIRSIFR